MELTVNGRRPDLEAITVDAPAVFIGEKLFPSIETTEPAGIISYLSGSTIYSAQTNRTDGNAPSDNTITLTGYTYSTGEVICRASITANQAVTMRNDISRIDECGAKRAKLSVMWAKETAQLNALVDSTGATTITAAAGTDPLAAVVAGIEKVSFYPGRKAVVMNLKTLCQLNNYCKMNELINFGGATSTEAQKEVLAGRLGVDEVLVASTQILVSGGTTSAVADKKIYCVALPDAYDPLSYMYNAELGRTIQQIPVEREDPIEVRSYGDENDLKNKYTAIAKYAVAQFNSGAKCIVDLGNIPIEGGKAVQITGSAVTLNGGTASVA